MMEIQWIEIDHGKENCQGKETKWRPSDRWTLGYPEGPLDGEFWIFGKALGVVRCRLVEFEQPEFPFSMQGPDGRFVRWKDVSHWANTSVQYEFTSRPPSPRELAKRKIIHAGAAALMLVSFAVVFLGLSGLRNDVEFLGARSGLEGSEYANSAVRRAWICIAALVVNFLAAATMENKRSR